MSQGLSDGDRAWLEDRFKEIREESNRQWRFASNLNTELKLHIQSSDTKHLSPCRTAQEEMRTHLEAKHNLTAKAKTIGIWAGMAAGIAEAVHWIHEYFKKG